MLGQRLGTYLVSPVLTGVDVDDIVRRIDVNDIVERIDVEALVARIDVDRLIVQRIDVDALLARVNVQELIERSNLERLVARSSTSICDSAVAVLRTLFVWTDQLVQYICQCRCCCRRSSVDETKLRNKRELIFWLPPKAGRHHSNKRPVYHSAVASQRFALAVALQGRYAGGFLQSLAWWLDQFIVSIVFSLAVLLLHAVVRAILDNEEWTTEGWTHMAFIFTIWSFVYTVLSLALTGRTIGLAVYGLMVVQARTGKRVDFGRAMLRALAFPFSVASIVGLLLAFVRRDGRGLQDLVACTGTVYAWDARMAQMRVQEMEASAMRASRYGSSLAGADMMWSDGQVDGDENSNEEDSLH